MRTTLTLDEDVAARLKRLLRKRDANLKAVVNDALRRGFDQLEAPAKANKPFRMKTYDMGEALFAIDNVAEALAFAEGEDFK